MDPNRHPDERRGPGIPRDEGLRKLDSGLRRNDEALASSKDGVPDRRRAA